MVYRSIKDWLSDLSEAQMRFVSVGDGVSVVSESEEEWEESKKRTAEKINDILKNTILIKFSMTLD